jgi:DNA-binding transcriptional regulator YhcF (GntR family)
MGNIIKSSKSRRRRRLTPSADIVAGLRARIVDGTFSAGQRLPTHVMIEKEFRSTPPTVAKALDVLKRDGFIRSEVGRGMFVTSRPPHQHHYALAMGSSQVERMSQFYVALRNEAARFQSSGSRFSIFYDIGQHPDAEDYQRLLGLVRSHRLAGLIFAESPFFAGRLALVGRAGNSRAWRSRPNHNSRAFRRCTRTCRAFWKRRSTTWRRAAANAWRC